MRPVGDLRGWYGCDLTPGAARNTRLPALAQGGSGRGEYRPHGRFGRIVEDICHRAGERCLGDSP